MATYKQITNANYDKEEEKYTGFVFGFAGIGKYNLEETAGMLLEDENKYQDYLYKIIKICEEKLKTCKYKVNLRMWTEQIIIVT